MNYKMPTRILKVSPLVIFLSYCSPDLPSMSDGLPELKHGESHRTHLDLRAEGRIESLRLIRNSLDLSDIDKSEISFPLFPGNLPEYMRIDKDETLIYINSISQRSVVYMVIGGRDWRVGSIYELISKSDFDRRRLDRILILKSQYRVPEK